MAKKIAFSGIMGALCFIFLYGSNLIPTTTIFLFCFSTVFLAAIVIECGKSAALTAYVAVSLLALLLLPDKLIALMFVLFFGYYPVVKYVIEQKNKLPVEWIIKILLFMVFLMVAYFVLQFFFVSSLAAIRLPLWSLFLAAEAVFVVYDLVLSLCIGFYQSRLHGKFRL